MNKRLFLFIYISNIVVICLNLYLFFINFTNTYQKNYTNAYIDGCKFGIESIVEKQLEFGYISYDELVLFKKMSKDLDKIKK